MKLSLILFTIVIACTVAIEEDQLETNSLSSESDLTYYFYSRSNQNGLVITSAQLTRNAVSSVFSASRPTMVLYHGWRDDSQANSNTFVRDAVLAYYDVNVIKVDWGSLAGASYASARRSVPSVGEFSGIFIQRLTSLFNYNLNQVTLVGFSLGAHAAGCAGATLKGQVAQIVGLDPAGPFISAQDTAYSLDPTDGRYVTVIHTNAGTMGMSDAIGHSDFYPNGGSSQPGCGIDIVGGCAHNRAWSYYAESLTSSTNGFRGQNCNSYRDFTNGRCSGKFALMGGMTLERSTGVYYLTTNSASPFGRG